MTLTAMEALKEKVVPIEYIGPKEYKTDNINHTKTVWNGKGDVQPYPMDKAVALLRFADVWRLGKASDLVPGTIVVDGNGALNADHPSGERTAREAQTANKESDGSSDTTTMGQEAAAGPKAAKSKNQRTIE